MKRTILIEIIAAILILLFLYVAVSKWIDMPSFVRAMHNQPFPSWLADIFVWAVPGAEVVISVLLMFRRTQHIGFIASLVLMCLFTLYIGSILLHLFPRVPCSCGGVIKQLSWTQHFIFNLFFVAIAAYGTFAKSTNAQTEDHLRKALA